MKVIQSAVSLEASAFVLNTEAAECPRGFVAGGVSCGLRKSGKPDLALFLCRGGATAAGVFTQNLVRAAPVDLSERHLALSGGKATAVLINSGCANAATGADGRRRAEKSIGALAAALGTPARAVLTASTGVIGRTLEVDRMIAAYGGLIGSASRDGLSAAATSIMTTDTVAKMAQVDVSWEGRSFRVSGVAKGSGMIHPNMATMLGVVLTDARMESGELSETLRQATDRTFNRISVDGDTSTNDCVFLLASGEAGEFPRALVAGAVERVCRELAMKIVRDGEGAKKFVHVRVDGARTEQEARKVAETVGGSLLVRTAIAGGDPNWGRILAAMGRSGVEMPVERVRVSAGGVCLFEDGAPVEADARAMKEAFAGPDVLLSMDLRSGDASAEYFTCDLTEGYIRINADYTT